METDRDIDRDKVSDWERDRGRDKGMLYDDVYLRVELFEGVRRVYEFYQRHFM